MNKNCQRLLDRTLFVTERKLEEQDNRRTIMLDTESCASSFSKKCNDAAACCHQALNANNSAAKPTHTA